MVYISRASGAQIQPWKSVALSVDMVDKTPVIGVVIDSNKKS